MSAKQHTEIVEAAWRGKWGGMEAARRGKWGGVEAARRGKWRGMEAARRGKWGGVEAARRGEWGGVEAAREVERHGSGAAREVGRRRSSAAWGVGGVEAARRGKWAHFSTCGKERLRSLLSASKFPPPLVHPYRLCQFLQCGVQRIRQAFPGCAVLHPGSVFRPQYRRKGVFSGRLHRI